MKRQFPRIERRALLSLAAALTTLGAACGPNTNVKPGAPVLTEVEIIENYGTASPTVTSIPSGVADCPSATTDGGAAAGINGGMCDPTVTICRQASASNWCRCVANSPPSPPTPCADAGSTTNADASTDAGAPDAPAMLRGTWNCAPFAPNSVALFVFDRLLDTVPLDPGDAGAITNAAMSMIAPPPPMSVAITADYASNGSPNEVIFTLLGDLRAVGPSLLFAGQPELPVSSTVTITLDGTKVRAKDGKTPFTGSGFLADGTLTYTTDVFSGTLTVPPPAPPAADAGVCTPPPTAAPPDRTPATATFDNLVDAATIGQHVTVTAIPVSGGASASVPFTATSMDGLNVSITPNANWPVSSTITITIDANAPDLLRDTLGAAVPPPGVFTTGAM
jgi:Bacterial Ig-like domain